MQQWTRMLFQIYAPAMGCLAVAGLLVFVGYQVAESPLLQGLMSPIRLMAMASLCLTLIAAAVATVFHWRWKQGSMRTCDCGGLLGCERQGRWGPFKRCLACGRNHARRTYAND